MKNFIILSAALLIFSSATTITAKSNDCSISQFKKGPQVPGDVLTAFDNLAAGLIHQYFGGVSYNSSGISWDHIHGLWVASGNVAVDNSTHGIHIVSASYKHNGNLVNAFYNPY